MGLPPAEVAEKSFGGERILEAPGGEVDKPQLLVRIDS